MDEKANDIEQPRKESLNPYRDQVIDEVADAILQMKAFGKDTLHSFAIYIRGLK